MDQQQPQEPTGHASTPIQTTYIPIDRKRKKIALLLLIGPTALIISSVILYAILNFVFSSISQGSNEGEMFATQSPIQHVVNVLLFLVGSVSVLAWVPGIIGGIILLATKRES